MPVIPFVGPTYQSRSLTFDAQRTVNLFPELSESGSSKSVAMLLGTPGLQLFTTLPGTGGMRALYTSSDGRVFAVRGGTAYEVSSTGAAQPLGTLTSQAGPVSMIDNGLDVVLVDGIGGYRFGLQTLTYEPIADEGFQAADRVAHLGGYFVSNRKGTGQFAWSDLRSSAFDPLSFATAERSPDQLVSLLDAYGELWLFGTVSTEVWFLTDITDLPFSPMQGGAMEQGCLAPHSVAKLANAVVWLGNDKEGSTTVWQARGYQPQRISTHAVEYALGQYSTLTDAVAWTDGTEGHWFYCLSFPTANATWVWDASTALWHERAYRNPTTAVMERHRGACACVGFGKHLVGDHSTGDIYEMRLDVQTDNGAPKRWIRRAPYISDDLPRIRHERVQVDFEAGVGLDGAPSVGADPQMWLAWSDDGAKTWSQPMAAGFGKIGEYPRRAVWKRLGSARSRVYEVSGSDPVKIALLGAHLNGKD